MSGPISAIVRALVAAKATPEMILAAVEAAEQANVDKLATRRAKDAERQSRFRDRHVTNVTSRDQSPAVASHAGASRAEPETTLSEENTRKEESKIPPPAERQAKNRLLPDDFVPSEATIARGKELGFTLAEIDDRLASMREWSLGKGERRRDWNLVLQGFLRRDADKRKHGTGPPQKPRRTSFLDIADAAEAYLRDGPDDPDPDRTFLPAYTQ